MQERTILSYDYGPPEHFRNAEVDLDCIRPNPAEMIARQANALDENRPVAVARRRTINQRTALKIAAQLVDRGSFEECGKLAIAQQQRPVKDLIKNTRRDGFIAGVATVKASDHGSEAASCTTSEYDYIVLIGNQWQIDHKKNEPQEDRPHADAGRGVANAPGVLRRKAVEVTAGRYDRPGQPRRAVFGTHCQAFRPNAFVASAHCFGRNAAMVGFCDFVIAAEEHDDLSLLLYGRAAYRRIQRHAAEDLRALGLYEQVGAIVDPFERAMLEGHCVALCQRDDRIDCLGVRHRQRHHSRVDRPCIAAALTSLALSRPFTNRKCVGD